MKVFIKHLLNVKPLAQIKQRQFFLPLIGIQMIIRFKILLNIQKFAILIDISNFFTCGVLNTIDSGFDACF